MRNSIALIILLLSGWFLAHAQDIAIKRNQSGLFSLGVRSTTSIFDHDQFGIQGAGYGGQFRLQFADRLNTEWFFDYMRGNVDGMVSRTDYHIGWSVMYYFTDKVSPPVKPYIVVGHCFDRTELVDNSNRTNRIHRGSSAIQAGGGVHFNLSPRMDITLLSQYMFHLGQDAHAHMHGDEVHLELHKGTGIEGHVLITLGVNYKIADLWYGGKKKK